MISKHLLTLTCAGIFCFSPVNATDMTETEYTLDNNQSVSVERFLLSEGNRVYIADNNETAYLHAGQQVILNKIKERGFWMVVDKPEYADFVLHYAATQNGRMQVALFIETPECYKREKDKISFTRYYSDAYKVGSRYADESVSNNESIAAELYQRINSLISNIAEGRINPDLKKRFTVTGAPQNTDITGFDTPSLDVESETSQSPEPIEVAVSHFSNPIIGTEYPHPAILKDGNRYYMTHSARRNETELTIYVSDNLINWKPISTIPLQRLGRAWTPDICRVGNLYYIYFTIRQSELANMTTNYVVYAPSPYGPWSTPKDLKILGVDPTHVIDIYKQRWLVMNGNNQIKLSSDGMSVIQINKVNNERSNQNPEDLQSGRIKFSQFLPH